MIASPAFRGRRYAVLGLARSGRASVETLLASGAEVMAWDSSEDAREKLISSPRSGGGVLPLRIADPLVADIAGYDGVVVSPGVPLNRHPIAARAREAGVPLIGDIELFAQARAHLPPHKVVGITGTNGKSTTTALVHHILETAGMPAAMGGNIGLPILAQDPLPTGGVYVLELSSYQLDLTFTLDCEVAALLNITPDHLDRYDSFEAYAASKQRLFAMQSPGQVAVVTIGEQAIASSTLPPGTIIKASGEADQAGWPALQGPHNMQNALAASAICDALGVPGDAIGQGLRGFRGLPHRMERVAEKGGVLFVNDSKATNPDSTAPALAAFPHVHWILGGLAKSDDLGPCANQLDHVRAAYTIGEAGPMFARLLEGRVPVRESELLVTAVRDASAAAVPGEVVLLSPACASFDQFRDYEARGDAFRAAVEALA